MAFLVPWTSNYVAVGILIYPLPSYEVSSMLPPPPSLIGRTTSLISRLWGHPLLAFVCWELWFSVFVFMNDLNGDEIYTGHCVLLYRVLYNTYMYVIVYGISWTVIRIEISCFYTPALLHSYKWKASG